MPANKQVESMLANIDIPIAHRRFKAYKNKPLPNPPYMMYITEEYFRGGDDEVFYKQVDVTLELYTEAPAPELEEKIESALSEYEFEKFDDELEKEHLYVVTYEFTLYEKLRR